MIIPAYNVEPFLDRCLYSIGGQTIKEFEVILINDGSTDGTGRIIREFAKNHKNIRVIDQENKGAAAARNEAIKIAKGDYLAFVDSDDFVSPDFLQCLYTTAVNTGAEITCCSFYHDFLQTAKKKEDIFMIPSGVYPSKKMLSLLIKDFRMHHYLWNKLWKKSLFLKNGIHIPDMCFEDIIVSTELFYRAKKIAVIKQPNYYYTRRQESLVGSINVKKFNDYIRSLAFIRCFLEKKGIYKTYHLSFTLYTLRTLLTCMKLLYQLKKGDPKRSIAKDLKDTVGTITYCLSKRFVYFDDVTAFRGTIEENTQS